MSPPHPRFPESPTLTARVEQTPWGDWKATVTLPSGVERTLTSEEVDHARAGALGVTREYLRTKVGHPGRLLIETPAGTSLIGVPDDDSEVVPLAETRPAERPAAAAPARRLRLPAVSPHRAAAVLLLVAVLAVGAVTALGSRGTTATLRHPSVVRHPRAAGRPAVARTSARPPGSSGGHPIAVAGQLGGAERADGQRAGAGRPGARRGAGSHRGAGAGRPGARRGAGSHRGTGAGRRPPARHPAAPSSGRSPAPVQTGTPAGGAPVAGSTPAAVATPPAPRTSSAAPVAHAPKSPVTRAPARHSSAKPTGPPPLAGGGGAPPL